MKLLGWKGLSAHGNIRVALSIPAATMLVLGVLPVTAHAAAPFTATGWITDVPVPGIVRTNELGEVSLRGNVHVVRIDSDDPRLTGRLQATLDAAYRADGTGTFYGAAYYEVGVGEHGPNSPTFTPSGGLWELKYRGVAQADNRTSVSHCVAEASSCARCGCQLPYR